jgi:N-methylhydantoinase A/oxoprolinase/acetone carboxylase beta subunit
MSRSGAPLPDQDGLVGPAAGPSAPYTRRGCRLNVIALDMGGTSADIHVRSNYEAGTTFNKWIQGYPRGCRRST